MSVAMMTVGHTNSPTRRVGVIRTEQSQAAPQRRSVASRISASAPLPDGRCLSRVPQILHHPCAANTCRTISGTPIASTVPDTG